MVSTSRVNMPKGYFKLSCDGIVLSTGMPVIKKNMSNTVIRITKRKRWYKKARNVPLVGNMIVDESSMSNR